MEVQTEQDECRTSKEPRRDGFGKDDGRCNHRGDGVDVDVIRGRNDAKALDANRPKTEASGRGYQAEKREVTDDDRLRQLLHCGQLFGKGNEPWDDADEAIEERLATDESRVVRYEQTNDDRIESPAKASSKGKRIAKWREVQHELTIEHNTSHAYESQCCSSNLHWSESLAKETAKEQCGEQRTAANDERCVGGSCVDERQILRQEIQTTARYAQGKHEQFVAQRVTKQLLVGNDNGGNVRYGKANGEDCCWRHSLLKEKFGRYECGSPHDDNGNGQHMKKDLSLLHAAKVRISLQPRCFTSPKP